MIIAKYRKQPVEVMDYDIDFSEYLGTDYLVVDTSDPLLPFPRSVVTPAGLTVTALDLIGTAGAQQVLKVTTSGGTTGVTYKVEVTAKSHGGRVKQVEFSIKVKED